MENSVAAGGDSKKVTIWSAAFVALLVSNFLRTMGQSLANTALPLYAYDLGAAASIVGIVSGSFAVTALLSRPFIGPAFDSFSKKKMILIFGIILAVAGYAYAFVDTIPAIIVVRLIHGLGMGGAAPLGMALASDILPDEKMNTGISIYSLAQALATAVGPAFAIWAVDALGYFATFMITGTFLVVCCIVVAIFVKEPEVASRPPYELSLKRAFAKRAIPVTIVVTLMTASFSCVGSFLAIYGQLMGVAQVGLLFTIYALCMLVTRPAVGKLADRFGTTKVVVPTSLAFIAAFVIFTFADGFPMMAVAAVVMACGWGAASPLLQSLIFQCVPDYQHGSASNTCFMGIDIGNLIGPYIGGFVVDVATPLLGSELAGYSAMWLIMTIPVAAGLILYLAIRGKIEKYKEEAAMENVAVLLELDD